MRTDKLHKLGTDSDGKNILLLFMLFFLQESLLNDQRCGKLSKLISSCHANKFSRHDLDLPLYTETFRDSLMNLLISKIP